jgi:hypothetical protein
MRTDSVIRIVSAHDARDAASRLTSRCLMEAAGPGSWPGSGGDAMNASGLVAAGRPARARPAAAAGHPVKEQRQGRHTRLSLSVPAGARHRVSAIAAALGCGRRQLTPALLGVG